MSGPPIVAGVDGSKASLRAVRWAAAEAALHHAPLLLIHAIGTPGGPVRRDWLDISKVESARLLREAAELAERTASLSDVQVETSLAGPVETFVPWTGLARMVVLGSSGRTAFGDFVLGSVPLALSGRAHGPLVVIRGKERAADLSVGVVVDDGLPNQAAIALAFEEASLRGVPLVVVRTGSEPQVLVESIAGWREKFPEVHVQLLFAEDRTRQHLIERSRDSQLLVVGTHRHGDFDSHALLHHAECPVLLTPAVSLP